MKFGFRSHRGLWFLMAAVILLVVGWGLIVSQRNSYQLIPIKMAPLKEVIYGIGTVQARHRFSFKVGLAKTIEKVFVREGDLVKKGDLLLALSDGLQIRSSISGVVVSLPYFAGENVFSDAPVVVIEDLKDRYITASLEQQGALKVRQGMSVRRAFDSLKGESFAGKVKSLIPKNGQFLAIIEVDKDLPDAVIPSMTADLGIEVSEKPSAKLVPIKAISSGYLTLQRQGHQVKVKLQLGAMDQEWVEVLSGDLQDQDLVVLPKK